MDNSSTAPDSSTEASEAEGHEGLLTMQFERQAGKVWLDLPGGLEEGEELGSFLYVEGLVAGLGSNPVGLDRGRIGSTRVISLRRQGNKLLVVEPNLRYRALTTDDWQVRATEESFATSVLWAGEIESKSVGGGNRVDFTGFLVRDSHGVVSTLRDSEQGIFALDESRSAVDFNACYVFPDNVEMEVLLTYTSDEPGSEVARTAPIPGELLVGRASLLVRLPDDGYRPRRFDPRAASYEIRFADYAAALDEPIDRRWIARHRLEKVTPGAGSSAVVEPIVYYIDRGASRTGAFGADATVPAGGPMPSPRPDYPTPSVSSCCLTTFTRSTCDTTSAIGSPGNTWMVLRRWCHRPAHRRDPSRVTCDSDRCAYDRTDSCSRESAAPARRAAARPTTLSSSRSPASASWRRTRWDTRSAWRTTLPRAPTAIEHRSWTTRPRGYAQTDGRLDFSHAYGVGVGSWDRFSIRLAYGELAPGADEEAELEG